MSKTRAIVSAVLATAAVGAAVAVSIGGTGEAQPVRTLPAPTAPDVPTPEVSTLSTDGADEPLPDKDDAGAGVGTPAQEPLETPMFEPVHETIAVGDQSVAPAAAPVDPLGAVDLSGHAPEGLDLSSIPGSPPAATTSGFGGPLVLGAGPGCNLQCITSGIAYPRGFGAELVVETNVPATIFMSVIADLDGDGDWDFDEYTATDGNVTELSWALDHLDPGQTYHVMVAATDEHDHTSHASGEFTTLSQRTIFVSYGDLEVWGGPDNVVRSSFSQTVNGEPSEIGFHVTPVDRFVDLGFRVHRKWGVSCGEEAWAGPSSPVGHSIEHCATWNTAWIDDLDLDGAPTGATRWTSTAVQADFQTPTGAGQALPADFGEPFEIGFRVPVTVYVMYS